MKTILFFLAMLLSPLWSEDVNAFILAEYKQLLHTMKDGKVDEAKTLITEDNYHEIFNEAAQKDAILAVFVKMKDFQIAAQEKIGAEISERMGDIDAMSLELNPVTQKPINAWVRDGVALYKGVCRYSNGNSGGTNTVIMVQGKFMFIRSFIDLPEMLAQEK
jgi:hypothetical protein